MARGECQPQVTPFVVSVLGKMPHILISMVGEQTPSLEENNGLVYSYEICRYACGASGVTTQVKAERAGWISVSDPR